MARCARTAPTIVTARADAPKNDSDGTSSSTADTISIAPVRVTEPLAEAGITPNSCTINGAPASFK